MTDKAHGGERVIYSDPNGEPYVMKADYDALRAQLAAAEKERDELRQERIWASAVLNQANELPSALRRAEQAESRLAAAEANAGRLKAIVEDAMKIISPSDVEGHIEWTKRARAALRSAGGG